MPAINVPYNLERVRYINSSKTSRRVCIVSSQMRRWRDRIARPRGGGDDAAIIGDLPIMACPARSWRAGKASTCNVNLTTIGENGNGVFSSADDASSTLLYGVISAAGIAARPIT